MKKTTLQTAVLVAVASSFSAATGVLLGNAQDAATPPVKKSAVVRVVSDLPPGCDADLLVHNYRVVRHALTVVMDDYYLEVGRAGARRYLAHHYKAMEPGACLKGGDDGH